MRTFPRVLPFVLTVLLLTQLSPAQASSGAAPAPKPPVSPSQYLLDSWNEIGRKLIDMGEDFPEDRYDFKPNPAQRSFAEQLLHEGGATTFSLTRQKALRLHPAIPNALTINPRRRSWLTSSSHLPTVPR